VTTGCPFNAARKADGSCCTARDYQVGGACGGTADLCPNGKPKKDGQCPVLCPDGSEKKPHALCPTKGESKKKKVKTKPRPNSDNPAPSGSGPQFNIQIGPGFPGGGKPGGGNPGGGNKGGCGLRCG
jgi:hypothetical protein